MSIDKLSFFFSKLHESQEPMMKEEEIINRNIPIAPSSSSSLSSTSSGESQMIEARLSDAAFPDSPSQYIGLNLHHNDRWPTHMNSNAFRPGTSDSVANFSPHSSPYAVANASPPSSQQAYKMKKEYMFEKQLTPSDVGKLNRLVIPKQHAERYFPTDSAVSEKGLLLNFEDPEGKPWRFRYSYWNSSQSYVLTKGWSRFVKENRLEAGDIVLFERRLVNGGIGWHLLIACRHRTEMQPNPAPLPFIPVVDQCGHEVFLPAPVFYVADQGHGSVGGDPSGSKIKRLRLFGVNLDCPTECKEQG